jgi:hypothetical protein
VKNQWFSEEMSGIFSSKNKNCRIGLWKKEKQRRGFHLRTYQGVKYNEKQHGSLFVKKCLAFQKLPITFFDNSVKVQLNASVLLFIFARVAQLIERLPLTRRRMWV